MPFRITTTSPRTSTSSGLMIAWSIHAPISQLPKITSISPSRESSTTSVANSVSNRANACSTSAAAGVPSSYMPPKHTASTPSASLSAKSKSPSQRSVRVRQAWQINAPFNFWTTETSTSPSRFVSVGMVEHVGRYNLGVYFQKAYRLLRPGGVFLNHGITLLHDDFKTVREVKNGFFARYIFPDGDLQPFNYILQFAANAGFEIRDVESLREHYALTLKCWRLRFEEQEEKIVGMLGRKAYRLWRLYLLGAGWGV